MANKALNGQGHKSTKRSILSIVVIVLSISLTSCLPTPTSGGEGSKTITVYGFSIMKESLEKEIYPAFAEKWKAEHNGEEITFQSSFAGSENITNQILQRAFDERRQRPYRSRCTDIIVTRLNSRLKSVSASRWDWFISVSCRITLSLLSAQVV